MKTVKPISDDKLVTLWTNLGKAMAALNKGVMSREGRLRVSAKVSYPNKDLEPKGMFMRSLSIDSKDTLKHED